MKSICFSDIYWKELQWVSQRRPREGRLDPPQVQHPGLHDEPEQVFQGFQGCKEQLCLAGVLSIPHVAVQDFGEFPLEIKQKGEAIQARLSSCASPAPSPQRGTPQGSSHSPSPPQTLGSNLQTAPSASALPLP